MTSHALSWKVLALCVILLVVIQVGNPQPQNGIEKRFSKWRFNKALGNLSPILKKVSIPNICKSGFLSGCVSDMRVSSVGTSKLTTHWNPSSSSGRLTVNIGHVTVKGKWRFKISWIFRDSGRFRLTFHNIHFSLSGYIRHSNKLVIKGCSCSVGSAKLRLSGGGSWLYNNFTGGVERSIKRQANDKFCKNSCNKLKWKSFKI